MAKVVVVDYGMGNLRSVAKALETVGIDVKVSSNAQDLRDANALVVPGVGAFGDAINNLNKLGLTEEIIKSIENGKAYLGICLGLQILFEYGYEFGKHKGLGVLKGEVVRFENKEGFKIPHMGWNQVWKKSCKDMYGDNIKDGEYFYFVHSFYVRPVEKEIIASTTDYITEFCSAIEKDNIWAVQFHPEKSQKAGLNLLKNFKKFIEKN